MVYLIAIIKTLLVCLIINFIKKIQSMKNINEFLLMVFSILLFSFIYIDSFAQENLIPNGNYESGGTPGCQYDCTAWGDYQISDWMQSAGSFDWFDWYAYPCPPVTGRVDPTTKLSNRCVGFYGIKNYSHSYKDGASDCPVNNVNESMMVQLKHKLRSGRTYKFKTKLYFNSGHFTTPPTSDLKIILRFSTSKDWSHLTSYAPNGNPNNNVKFNVPITIDYTKINQWIDIETNIAVPLDFNYMVDWLIIQGDENNQESYIYFDDTELYSSCESYCAPANISDPIEFVSGAEPQDMNVCVVNTSPWGFIVKNSTEIWFRVFYSWGGEFVYIHEKNPDGLLDPGYSDYMFLWNGCNDGGTVPPDGTVFSYVLKIANCNDYLYSHGSPEGNNSITVFGDPNNNPPETVPYYYSDSFNEDCCEDNKYYQNTLFTGTFRKDVNNFIIAGENVTNGTTGPVIVKNGANVKFNAGNNILLEPGFSVEYGATFEANIADCAENINKIIKTKRYELNKSFVNDSLKGNHEKIFFSSYPNPFSRITNINYHCCPTKISK